MVGCVVVPTIWYFTQNHQTRHVEFPWVRGGISPFSPHVTFLHRRGMCLQPWRRIPPSSVPLPLGTGATPSKVNLALLDVCSVPWLRVDIEGWWLRSWLNLKAFSFRNGGQISNIYSCFLGKPLLSFTLHLLCSSAQFASKKFSPNSLWLSVIFFDWSTHLQGLGGPPA